jgi:hypothetical protein
VPRYKFRLEDLAPLKSVLSRPEVQRILSRAVPVKLIQPAPADVEAVIDPLPIKLRTRENPGGVPLAEVNALVKQRVPGVSSVIVRDGSVLVAWERPPTPEMRAKVKTALTDRKAFQAIQDKVLEPPPSSQAELKAKLCSATTADDEWLRTFRRYYAATLAGEREE